MKIAEFQLKPFVFYKKQNIKGTDIDFQKPNFTNEWGEIYKAPKGKKTVIDTFTKLGFAKWVGIAKKGGMVKVTKSEAKKIENTNAGNGLVGWNEIKGYPDGLNKQKRAQAQLDLGEIELPILASYDDGEYRFLIAGNTRFTLQIKTFGEGYVWQFDVPDKVANLLEE